MSSPPQHRPAAGADVGASLIKLALRDDRGRLALECFASDATGQAAERIHDVAPGRVAVTGCGAPQLARQLPGKAFRIDEFEAWAVGARACLQREPPAPDRFLMVTIGTGTSALLVEPTGARRVGGTALGGGTIVGLAGPLLGTTDFDAVAELAAGGDRSQVDLLVGDIYEDDFELSGALNAASFGKLARGATSRPEDRAHALMGLVGENVGMICAALAQHEGVDRVVFGGGSLRRNAALGGILRAMCQVRGLLAEILPDGEYTGALGALTAAEQGPDRQGSRATRR